MLSLYRNKKINKNKILFNTNNSITETLSQSINFIKIGQIIKITSLILDNKKLRKITFVGRCIAFKKCKNNSFITLRNNINGVGVENSFLILSPSIIYLQILHTPVKRYKRSKLYFLQQKSNKFNTIKLT